MEYVIKLCKERTTEAMEYFLNTLSFVPEDKLTWSPAPTAKNALQITAHCAGYSQAFAEIIRAGGFAKTVEEFRAPILARIDSVTTVQQGEAMLRQGVAATLAALDTVKPEKIAESVEAPQGKTPFTFFLNLPAMHLDNHAAQIDYLQTCWGDQEVHF